MLGNSQIPGSARILLLTLGILFWVPWSPEGLPLLFHCEVTHTTGPPPMRWGWWIKESHKLPRPNKCCSNEILGFRDVLSSPWIFWNILGILPACSEKVQGVSWRGPQGNWVPQLTAPGKPQYNNTSSQVRHLERESSGSSWNHVEKAPGNHVVQRRADPPSLAAAWAK